MSDVLTRKRIGGGDLVCNLYEAAAHIILLAGRQVDAVALFVDRVPKSRGWGLQ